MNFFALRRLILGGFIAVGASLVIIICSSASSFSGGHTTSSNDERELQSDAELALPDKISFNAHIRPIMSNTCFACHGPDEEENKSELRLDSYAGAVDDGEAIVPGNADDSLVYQRIISQDDPMPPADFRHKLSPREKALFRKWIEQGAKYESHWSYTPIQRPAIPELKKFQSNVANEIDSFILARLEQENLAPSVGADKATLLRRLSLDLIGLPPTMEELDVFLADDSPDAYENQVERLLGSPHFGERMASGWLDIVRFSDTVGFHGDQNQRIFPYRDYVIDAFNSNKPFDVFTTEQLAGDLLENPTPEQLTATGLVRLNMMTREGGAQPEEYLAKYSADRVRMLGTAFLGATTGCCECHNHKYDPFTIKDFYSLAAFFDDLQQWGVYTSYQYTPNPDLRGFNNNYPFPPEMRVRSKSLESQIEHLETTTNELIASSLPENATESPALHRWAQTIFPILEQHSDGWVPLEIVGVKSQKKTPHRLLDDQSVLLTGKARKSDVIVIRAKLPADFPIKMVRLEVLPDDANRGYIGRGKNGGFVTALSLAIAPDNADNEADDKKVDFAFGLVDRGDPKKYISGQTPRFLGKQWRSGPIAWQLPRNEAMHPHTANFHLPTQLTLGDADELVFKIKSQDIGRVRLSVSPLTRFVVGMPAAAPGVADAIGGLLAKTPLNHDQRSTLLGAWHLSSTDANSLPTKIINYRNEIVDCRSGYAMTLVAQQADEKKWRQSRVLPRGDWQAKDGEVVVPATPSFLPRLENTGDQRLTRLDLAHWLTSKQNPLTARHFVNRLWKQFFGAGLSNRLDDLGNQGEWPSHPDLLNWLAAEFRDTWDVKHMVRLIVTSNTYRQRAAYRADLAGRDYGNRLLAQQSARRLDAESVRDNALAISGLLFKQYIGGPSIFPYQPEGHYRNLQFPDRRYVATENELQYRRGVYVHWQRTFLHPMLVNFDAPSRDECVADRSESNSPQQALTLLNDPQFVESSNAFADRIFTEYPDAKFNQRLTAAFKIALARQPTSAEQKSLKQFFDRQFSHYDSDRREIKKLLTQNGLYRPGWDGDQAELAAWAQVCRVILNLHETITRF